MHDTLLLFGATGDLAQRYLFPSLLRRNRLMTDMSWEELNRAQAVAVDLYREIEELPPRPAAAEMGTPAATAP